jgi:hypothetical protein
MSNLQVPDPKLLTTYWQDSVSARYAGEIDREMMATQQF